MDAKELRQKSPAQLTEELHSLLRAHFSLRMQHATQQLTNSSEIARTRRAIARVRTVMAEKMRQGSRQA
jgi:large subunit ribosomal protein L29